MGNNTAVSPKKIHVTHDYDIFKKLSGNRDVTKPRVDKIKKSIADVGYITSPITVNEQMQVIDGQARVEAYRDLGIPVEYVIHQGAGIAECIAMNIQQTAWETTDYIDSYCQQDNINYKRLKAIKQEYNTFTYTFITGIIADMAVDSGHTTNLIKSGNLIITPEMREHTENILCTLNKFVPYVNYVGGKMDSMYSALAFCIQHPEINNNRMLELFKSRWSTIKPPNCITAALQELEKLYNYRITSDKTYITMEYDKYMIEKRYATGKKEE